MSKKILVVLTSGEKYPNLNRATGLWLGEAVHFVKKVEEAGYEVDYVRPKGGYTPIDPHSLAMEDPVIPHSVFCSGFDLLSSTQRLPPINWRLTCRM
jgi:hypothetical protein